jgi:hypothetical protein
MFEVDLGFLVFGHAIKMDCVAMQSVVDPIQGQGGDRDQEE